MPPEIMQTAILNEWVIVTRSTKKEGYNIAHTKYPITEIVLEQICYDVLLKQTKGCEKGYSFVLTNKKTKEEYKVTVEKITKECAGAPQPGVSCSPE